MKRQLGIALAGAVLAAGTVGGVGFAAGNGRNGSDGQSSTQTNTSTNTHDPAAAASAIRCANLQLQIVQAQLRIASARNPHQARALTKKVVALQQQFLRECT
jgi:hypothetical protein